MELRYMIRANHPIAARVDDIVPASMVIDVVADLLKDGYEIQSITPIESKSTPEPKKKNARQVLADIWNRIRS